MTRYIDEKIFIGLHLIYDFAEASGKISLESLLSQSAKTKWTQWTIDCQHCLPTAFTQNAFDEGVLGSTLLLFCIIVMETARIRFIRYGSVQIITAIGRCCTLTCCFGTIAFAHPTNDMKCHPIQNKSIVLYIVNPLSLYILIEVFDVLVALVYEL